MLSSRLFLCLMALLCCWSSAGWAAKFRWNAELELGVIAGRGKRVESRLNNYAGLTADASASARWKGWRSWARVTFDTRYDGELGSSRAEPELREFALRYRSGDWEASIGRQQIVWGRADGFNPSNVLGVRDFGRVAIWDDEHYRGVDVARLDWRSGDGHQWSLLVLPHWRRSRLVAGFEENIARVSSERSRAVDIDDPGAVLRYEHLGSGFDYSLTAGRVSEFAPYFRLAPDASGTLQRRFGETWFAAGDFAWNWDSWVLRGEFAYLDRESGLTAPRDEFSAVLAAERELNERLTLNVQGIHTQLDGLVNPATLGVLGDAAVVTAQVFHQQRAQYTGASINLTLLPANFLGRLETTVLAFHGNEWLIRARGEYSLGSQGKLEAIAEHYRGPAASTFDGLADNNGFWLRWTYLFTP